MEIPVCEAEKVVVRAKYLKACYGYDDLTSIQIAEQELEKQKKMGEENE